MSAEFFSFGTSDLTQTGLGMSRDDSGSFLPHYQELEIVTKNPFATIDATGVGAGEEVNQINMDPSGEVPGGSSARARSSRSRQFPTPQFPTPKRRGILPGLCSFRLFAPEYRSFRLQAEVTNGGTRERSLEDDWT